MNSNSMTSNELASSGRALYGDQWQAAFARDLNVSDRTLRRWLSNDMAIPDGIGDDVRALLLKRIDFIGGMIGYSVNSATKSILHYPTLAYFRIEDTGTLSLLFDKLVPADQRDIVIAGAEEALRREKERNPSVVGQFVWA